ncbi:MAG: hypothetical protein GY851_24985, partial [bacterium]|nr:hypothetical protein [bacterium]
SGLTLRESIDLPAPCVALAAGNDMVWVATTQGLFHLADGRLLPVEDLPATAVRDVATHGDQVAIAADEGLFLRQPDGTWTATYPHEGARSWAPRDVRAVAYDGDGALWFASPQGAGHFDGAWRLCTGAEGLPHADFTCLATGKDGSVWFGTHQGAVGYDGTHWAYREGRRWLPGNDVRDGAIDSDGDVWLATDKGVGCIERWTTTLADKARHYNAAIDRYNKRTPYGYVYQARLAKPGDLTEVTNVDSDNDGQWTGMYGAAQCFEYAVTGDPNAKQRAKDAFEAMRFLVKVSESGTHPAPRGFPARAILPTSGPDPNKQYTLEKDERERATGDALWKVMHPRWPVSEDGQWYWKCDTSSDELDGHFFFYPRYYDLVADTDEEKERVRDVVASIMDHLIDHDFHLVDWDGQPTRWANFDPKSLNADPDWFEERGLNSLSVLSYLAATAHVTGDPKYRAVAQDLIDTHHYDVNGMIPKIHEGPGTGTQFDDEMAFMNYYNLLSYETDPELRSLYAVSMHGYWLRERPELDSFYNFVYAAMGRGMTIRTTWETIDLTIPPEAVLEAVDTLRRYPMDLLNWRLTNSHRQDLLSINSLARQSGGPVARGYRLNGTVLPIDERYLNHWSDDPWQTDTGGDGMWFTTGTPFLLACYLGLYHGIIE